MTAKEVIHALQAMIDTGAITGEEEFGAFEYSLEEGDTFRSPDKLEIYTDEVTEETIVHF